MNIDELTNKIRKVSSKQNVQDLAELIQQWKTDEKNAIELKENVERYLGNSWIDKKADFEKVYGMWSDFRDSAINGIGGMTMNERLYLFGLFDLYDKAPNNAEQEKFYAKLMAKK
ncbi:hypothetical protein H4O18_21875 [Arenibacter sp. BSSL-BM3]|uniref:Uncharacterized protein n=1 Tax=Arenibacter arenosicollis TaxID=2762274 RepID=A0ABR7QU11_9FLAO|nr:hypothetical protein [Arenibacter arenosicollis]MBC8770648.1 hypothetical protein [Arenibacter arenosicollis]